MNTSSRLRRTIRRLTLIALLTVAGGAAGATYAAVKTPTYTAKAYVVAIAAQSDPATALNFAQAYGRIATSGPVLASARPRLTDTTGLSSVRSSTSPDAPVVEIVATAADARHTADLANAVAGALSEYASKRSKDTSVKLSVLAPATVPARPTSPRPPLELVIGATAGLLIGGLAALGTGRGKPPEPAAAESRPLVGGVMPIFPAPHMTDLNGQAVVERPVSSPAGVVPPPRVVGRATVEESEEQP